MITRRKVTGNHLDVRLNEQGLVVVDLVEEAKQGAELLAEAAAEPTLDIYLDRSPKLGTPINYEEMVGVLRKKRVAFITAEANKKAGVKPTEKTDDDEA